jgi:hypothetical protein
MAIVVFGRENRQRPLRFRVERTDGDAWSCPLGILRCAQNDGKNLQRQKNGKTNAAAKTTTLLLGERVHPTHRSVRDGWGTGLLQLAN